MVNAEMMSKRTRTQMDGGHLETKELAKKECPSPREVGRGDFSSFKNPEKRFRGEIIGKSLIPVNLELKLGGRRMGAL